jgi:glycosyltransferase involved in cell wall biosynthesis
MPSAAIPFPASAFARPRTASILVNNFNYGRFLGEAIESALSQTEAAEVIVVDDGSTDDSRQIIEGFGSRIRAILKTNGGHGSAMNAGFSEATGDLVLFLDSDDRLESTAVATLLRTWQPGTVLAQFPLHIVSATGERSGIHPDPPSNLSQGDVRPELLATGSFGVNVTTGLAFLRQALDGIMPLPEGDLRNCGEGYLVRAVAFLGPVQRLDAILGSYRFHDANFSNLGATPGGLAAGFRKKIHHADMEFGFTRQLAAQHGLTAQGPFEELDVEYAGYRLFLRLTDPTSQAERETSRWRLLARYVTLRWRSAWPFRRRVMATAVAAAATICPTSYAAKLVGWLHYAKQRPRWWRALASMLRGT